MIERLMDIPFEKYHGAGNDFILMDTRSRSFIPDFHLIRQWCDRRFGIGADGLILVGNDPAASFSMRYFNSDGKESTMCGNGGRCVAWYALRHGLAAGNMVFTAIDGLHRASVLSTSGDSSVVKLKMKDVPGIRTGSGYFTLDTGSPHYVSFFDEVGDLDIRKLGATVRYSEAFREEGINVNFAARTPTGLVVRTYERGVEEETLSCGTGVTAAALVAAMNDPSVSSPLDVKTPGGQLVVHFTRQLGGFSDIWLEGPAVRVFTGIIVHSQ